MNNIDKSSQKYVRLFVFSLVVAGAWLFGGYTAGSNRAEAQTDLLLERRIGQVEKDDTVFPIRCSFTRDNADFSVGGCADVVNQARIEWNGIDLRRMRGI